ncbi:hypothetical protein MMC11_004116 [Xylographa trunciseda]|nr:hypothetical protein [Xylographa trunciseda]
MSTPRVFIIRHGETEWSLNGRHTGISELPLTANGEKRIRATGKALVGDDRLIVPSKISHIYVSPRRRAQRTLELLDLGCHERLGEDDGNIEHGKEDLISRVKVQITEDIREWDYGDYEGKTSPQVREERKAMGLKENWDIWRDGCPGGESPTDVSERLDRLIADIRTRFHGKAMGKKPDDEKMKGDVLVVAHGHILRAFAMRWIGRGLTEGVSLLLEAGGVGTLRYGFRSAPDGDETDSSASYEHNRIEEPAILLGGAFVVDLVDNIEKS